MADTTFSKAKKPTKKATHPKYSEMITAAIESLKEKEGSSRVAIIKVITSKYKVSNNPNVVNNRVKLFLKKGVESGVLTQVKGSGASGSFKLAKKATAKQEKTVKKSAQKATAKQEKAVKKPAKKATAKPEKAVKKPTKKVTFKSPKKVESNKAAKSPKTVKSLKKPKAAKSPKKAASKKEMKPKVKKPSKK